MKTIQKIANLYQNFFLRLGLQRYKLIISKTKLFFIFFFSGPSQIIRKNSLPHCLSSEAGAKVHPFLFPQSFLKKML